MLIAGTWQANAQSFIKNNLPLALSTDGYFRLDDTKTQMISFSSSDRVVSFNYSTCTVNGITATPTMSDIKLLISPAPNFGAAEFVQADAVSGGTAQFTIPARLLTGSTQYYNFAMSASADLAVVTIGQPGAQVGSTITYNVEVTNAGPADVTGVVLKLPNLSNFTPTAISMIGVQYSKPTTATTALQVATPIPAGTDLKTTGISIPNIAAFGGVSVAITGTVAALNQVAASKVIDASSTVTMAGVDLDSTNNSSTFITQLYDGGTLSTYQLDKDATAANAGQGQDPSSSIDAAGNYNFNLVFTLTSGSAVPGLGNSFTIPVSFSPLVNKANGQPNRWEGVTRAGSGSIYVVPYTDLLYTPTSPYGMFNNLPATNHSPFDTGSKRIIDPNNLQVASYDALSTGFIAPLGLSKMTIGNVPAYSPNFTMKEAKIWTKGSGNGYGFPYPVQNPTTNIYTNIYYMTMLGSTNLPNTSLATVDSLRPGASYPFTYYALRHDGRAPDGNGFNGDVIHFGTGLVLQNGIITFSGAQPLPLSLVSFDAKKANEGVLLNWATTAEVNTRSFEVERSGNGRDFTNIGTVAAANSSGNHSYTFTDHSPLGGTNIYRLKMTDIDGKFTYSFMKSATIPSIITASPNPARDVFYVKNAPVGSTVKVVNMAGRMIQQLGVVSANQPVNISGNGTGIFVVQVVQNNEIIATFKVVKQ